MTVTELIEKYPKIFVPYEGNPNNINWYGIRKGWVDIIDTLCSCIQWYCDGTDSIENALYEDGRKYDANDIRSHRYIKVNREQITCVQLKEKFGELRFYTNSHNEYVSGLIRFADAMCSKTCTHCGSIKHIKMRSGWIEPVCQSCVEINNYIASVDTKMIDNVRNFVELAVTEQRLLQAISWLQENGKEVSEKSTGDFLRWIVNDVMKEEQDTIVANQYDVKKVNSEISNKSRIWFFNYINTNY